MRENIIRYFIIFIVTLFVSFMAVLIFDMIKGNKANIMYRFSGEGINMEVIGTENGMSIFLGEKDCDF